MKKVLIIIPTFNRGIMLKNVITNIIDQTYTNWTLVIIDDGSNSKNIQSYNNLKTKYQNDKIIFMQNTINKGIGFTLNKGLKYLLRYENDYDYVTWISDDNIYYTNFIEELVNSCDGYDFTHSIHKILKQNKQQRDVYTDYKTIDDILNNWRGCASFMWSTNIIKINGLYRENINGVEDYEYLLRTYSNTTNVNFVNKCLMTYKLHDDSLYTKKFNEIKKLTQIIKNQYINKQPSVEETTTNNTKLINTSTVHESINITNTSNILIYYSKKN